MDIEVQRRLDFVIKLLAELKAINCNLKSISNAIEMNSESFYRKVFDDNRNEIDKDITVYNSNMEKTGFLYNEIITKINNWYNFVNNSGEIKKITYPLKFIHRKKKLKSFIKKANEEISNITIENRFIKEHLSVWDHDIELKAVKLMNEGEDYKNYIQLKRKKEEIISELKYLLPTITDSHHIELDLDNLDVLIDELSKSIAA